MPMGRTRAEVAWKSLFMFVLGVVGWLLALFAIGQRSVPGAEIFAASTIGVVVLWLFVSRRQRLITLGDVAGAEVDEEAVGGSDDAGGDPGGDFGGGDFGGGGDGGG